MTGVTLSFEFFPPKTETGAEKLWNVVRELGRQQPQFVSVTCGAGGSAIDGTSKVVHHIRENCGQQVAPHIAIARQSRSRVREVLQEYKKAGIRRIVAVRGDPAQEDENVPADDAYSNTIDFVAELRGEFGLEPIVAAYPDVHPRALSPQQDLDHLKRKAAAGAALAISQFFFLPETFLHFRDKVEAAGIETPLVPGILPIHNLAQAIKFAGMCGTIIPDGFAHRFERHAANAEALFDEGVTHAIELCGRLRQEGINHFHFYTLNHCEMTVAVCRELGVGAQGSEISVISPSPEPRTPIPSR